MRSRALLILFALSLALSCVRMGPDRQTESLLQGLDTYLETRDLYVAQKQNQLAALTKLARDIEDPTLRYNLEFTIAQEYFSFSFDSTQAYLKHCQQLAGADKDRYDEASIALGHLYEKAGNYMEAYTFYMSSWTARACPRLCFRSTCGYCTISAMTWQAIPAWWSACPFLLRRRIGSS